MANLSYSTSVQNKVAQRLFQQAYSALTSDQKAMLDGTSSASPPTDGVAEDAWNYINDAAQLLYLQGAGNAPDTWERWLVARMVYLAGQIARPDRMDVYNKIEQNERAFCISTYVTADPNGATVSTNATTLTPKALRFYALNALMKHDPPIYVTAEDLDHAMVKVMQDMWYRADWVFKRRPVTMTVTPYNITGATWTAATKTLTKTGELATTIPVNTMVYVKSGTNAVIGNYRVASATANTVVLTTDIGATDGSTDIAFSIVAVTFDLTNSEVFHKPATRRWYCIDSNGIGAEVSWGTDGDGFTSASVNTSANTARPFYFRYFRNPTTSSNWTYNWSFAPIPDQTYRLRGEAFITCPDAPSSSTDQAALSMFPKEMWPLLKDMVYSEILRKYRPAEGTHLIKQINEELERVGPLFVNQGNADQDMGVRDVNRDAQAAGSNVGWWYGGLASAGGLGGMGVGGGMGGGL